MFDAQRQHPVAALTSSLKVVREHIIKIILVYLVGGQQSQSTFFSVTGISILLAFLLLWGILSWFRYTYRIEDGVLRIEYGIFVRKKLRIPRQRIQVIDISSGVLQRLFGLVSLNVQTAGQSSEETELSAVTREEAERIQSLLRIEDKEEAEAETETEEQHREKGPVYKLSINRLLTAGITSGSIGVALSIIGTLLSQINDLLAETRFYEMMDDYFKSTAGLIMTLALAMLVAGLLLAFLGTLIRYADFSITRKKDELVISRGFFERKRMTIPLNRIQSIRLVEGILRQPFGLLSVQVDSAGYAREEGTSTELFPLLKRREVRSFLSDMIPEFDVSSAAVSPPPRSQRRFIVRMVVPALLLLLTTIYFEVFGYWMLGILPLAAGWGALMYRDAAAGVTSAMAFMRYRKLGRTTVLVPRGRMQRLTFEQNILQKRGQVMDLMFTVASGRTGASFRVRHMDAGLEKWWPKWLLDGLDTGEERESMIESGGDTELPGFY